MTWTYKIKRMTEGDRLTLPDGDMLVGSNIEPDGKGGFRVVAHVMVREDGAPLSQYDEHAAAAERAQ